MNDHERKMAREFMGYILHIIWPVLIIVVIAKLYAPSSF